MNSVFKRFLFLICLILPYLAGPAVALKIERKAQVGGIVWGMAELIPGEILFTLREGRAGVFTVNSGEIRWLTGLPKVVAKGQGGLLDVAVYSANQEKTWLYFTYSKPTKDGAVTNLSRAVLINDELEHWQDLLSTQSATDTDRHYGSRIAFDDQGHVFFGIGDRGHRPNGQDLSTHAGSIVRLNLDGSVPADNPFVNTKNTLPEIWSYGHRNPQGLCFEKQSKRLWSSEHGPRGGDEINLIEKGKNYGWATVSHGKEYWGPFAVGEAISKPGMVDPQYIYIPSIAPGSLLCYQGNKLAEFQNRLILGALKLQHLNTVKIHPNGKLMEEQRWFDGQGLRIRSLLQDSDGGIWFATDNGSIYKVIP
ncbi:MAG: PQQ-dependent sugar dehydrogenase [Pseudomonadales bacterium]|nr:PQQ-dependent sugar dehydrogenase [Pseudomonadales bacterium]